MRNLLFAAALLLASASGFAQMSGLLDSANEAASGSLDSLLSSQLGASQEQVEGGLGSIFSLAQEKLSAGDFDQILSAVPGAAGYMDKAKQLGVLDSPIENVEGLSSALGQLGMSPDLISSFLPAAVDAIGMVGGSDIQQMLSSLISAG